MTRAVARDPETAELNSRDRAMVDFALKLTRSPSDMTRADIAPLRDQGLGDDSILWLVEVIGYFNYVNRLADGLGVALEPGKWDPISGTVQNGDEADS